MLFAGVFWGSLGISAALVYFEPGDRLRRDPISRFGLRFEAIDSRLSPAGKRETHVPTRPVGSLHRIEFGFGLNSGHDRARVGASERTPHRGYRREAKPRAGNGDKPRAAMSHDLKTPVNRLFARLLSGSRCCWTAATNINEGLGLLA